MHEIIASQLNDITLNTQAALLHIDLFDVYCALFIIFIYLSKHHARSLF